MGFPGGSVIKNPPVNGGGEGSIPGSGKIPWRKNWQPTQFSCLEKEKIEKRGGPQYLGSQRVRLD